MNRLNNTIFQQLKHIELKYNTYEIDRKIAQKLAKPLLDKFNFILSDKSQSYNSIKNTLLKMSNFSFGR